MKKLFAFMVSLFCLVTNAAAQTTKFLKVWTYFAKMLHGKAIHD